MSDAPHTQRVAGSKVNMESRKPAELLALSGFSAFSGHFRTQKLLRENSQETNPMCVCERTLYYYSLPENPENPETTRNMADFRVAGFVEIGNLNPETQRATTHHPQIHAAVTGRSSVGELA